MFLRNSRQIYVQQFQSEIRWWLNKQLLLMAIYRFLKDTFHIEKCNIQRTVLLFSEYHCKQELNNIPSKIMYVFTWSIQIKNRQIANWHLNILDDGYNSLLFSFQQRRKKVFDIFFPLTTQAVIIFNLVTRSVIYPV